MRPAPPASPEAYPAGGDARTDELPAAPGRPARALREGAVPLRGSLGILAVIVLFVGARLPYFDFVPLWDGRVYWEGCLAPAVTGGFDLLSFNCFGHPSMLYMLPVALPQYLDLGNVALLHGVNLAFGIVSILAFHGLLGVIFPASRGRLERVLATAVFAAFPAIQAAALNLNPDYGVLVYFLLFLMFLMTDRFRLAAVFAVALLFSKESGLVLYPVALGSYLLVFVWSGPGGVREKIRESLVRSYGFLPGVLFLLYAGVNASANRSVLWVVSDPAGDVVRSFLTFEPFDPTFRAYLAGIFVIDFNWIPTGLLVAAGLGLGGAALARRWRGRAGFPRAPEPDQAAPIEARVEAGTATGPGGERSGSPASDPPAIDRRAFSTVVLVAAGSVFLLTRFKTFANLRYLVPTYPILFLLAFGAIRFLVKRPRLRSLLLLGWLALVAVSNVRTIDPVSKRVYGTFRFGSHELLRMTSITRECCGAGRDQLLYNLEFTAFHYVQNEIYAAIRPTERTFIAAHPLADFALTGAIDRTTFERTLRRENAFAPYHISPRTIMKRNMFPRRLYYVDYPNFDDARNHVALAKRYDHVRTIVVGRHGYTVPVHELALRLAR